MSEFIKSSRDGGVAVITIDNPPVNALSPGVPEGLRDAIQAEAARSDVQAIVVTGALFWSARYWVHYEFEE